MPLRRKHNQHTSASTATAAEVARFSPFLCQTAENTLLNSLNVGCHQMQHYLWAFTLIASESLMGHCTKGCNQTQGVMTKGRTVDAK